MCKTNGRVYGPSPTKLQRQKTPHHHQKKIKDVFERAKSFLITFSFIRLNLLFSTNALDCLLLLPTPPSPPIPLHYNSSFPSAPPSTLPSSSSFSHTIIPRSDQDPVTYLSLLLLFPPREDEEEGERRAAPLTPLMPLPSFVWWEMEEGGQRGGEAKMSFKWQNERGKKEEIR